MKNQNIRVRLIIFKGRKVLLMHDSEHKMYYYPGGHVEFGETLLEAAKRECLEECGTNFIFDKVLYIRDYFDKSKDEHALEIFMLGSLKDSSADNSKDPVGRKTQSLEWYKVDFLPKNLYPKALSKKLKEDYEKGFLNQGEYIGVIE